MSDDKYIGKPCRKCSETLRYIKGSRCVACKSTRYKEWSAKNKQHLREKDQAWYKENKPHAHETNSAWQQANSEKLNRKARDRYKKDPEHVLAIHKRWRETPAGKAKLKAYQKERYRRVQLAQYDLTEEQYASILEDQGGTCAICNSPPKKINLAVDHCHTTGKVRGILCGTCNRALGLFKDSSRTLKAAAAYLEKNK